VVKPDFFACKKKKKRRRPYSTLRRAFRQIFYTVRTRGRLRVIIFLKRGKGKGNSEERRKTFLGRTTLAETPRRKKDWHPSAREMGARLPTGGGEALTPEKPMTRRETWLDQAVVRVTNFEGAKVALSRRGEGGTTVGGKLDTRQKANTHRKRRVKVVAIPNENRT